jgi:hypothetical protein
MFSDVAGRLLALRCGKWLPSGGLGVVYSA